MTFKAPSPLFYLVSLLIAALISAAAYWILAAQGMDHNGYLLIGAGLFIGHLVGVCIQPTTAQTSTGRVKTSATTNQAAEETISLYVGNLAYRAQRDDVRELFEQYGAVNSVRIMTDRATRRPRGYAFVEMGSSAAREALKHLDNTEFCGRTLRVSEAKQRQE